MKKIIWILAFLLTSATVFAETENSSAKIEDVDKYMTIKEPDSDNMVWYRPDPSPDSKFRLIGFYWFDKEHEYRRLPKNPDYQVTPGVAYLSRHTAGGQIRFRTNSTRVQIKATTSGFGAMNHMPQTGSGGFDLYVGDGNKQIYHRTTTYGLNETSFKTSLFNMGNGEMHDFTINFPLYNGVESVEIGIDADAKLEEPLKFVDDRPIVIYGTSITQGGCASRPGSLFTNILSRRLNRPFINLGFSGNGRGEIELAQLINQIENPALIILDYEGNAEVDMNKTLEPFMATLRAHAPNVPILIVTRIRFSEEALFQSNTMSDARQERATIRFMHQKNEYDKWIASGDKNIYFLDGGTLMGDDYSECTVDGIHPTDMGFYRMADTMEPVLRNILEK